MSNVCKIQHEPVVNTYIDSYYFDVVCMSPVRILARNLMYIYIYILFFYRQQLEEKLSFFVVITTLHFGQ